MMGPINQVSKYTVPTVITVLCGGLLCEALTVNSPPLSIDFSHTNHVIFFHQIVETKNDVEYTEKDEVTRI